MKYTVRGKKAWAMFKCCFRQTAETIALVFLFCLILYSDQIGWRIFGVIDAAVLIFCKFFDSRDRQA